jgi:hypothetical protein
MTDLRDVLDSAARPTPTPTPDVVSGDLRRGRQALLRRRMVQSSAGLLLTGAAVVAGVLVVPGLTEPAQRTVAIPAAGGNGVNQQPDAVALVPAPASDKAAAFTAALVPEGWRVDSNDLGLTIAAPGVTTSSDDFTGKLVVMLSPDQAPAPGAHEVRVGAATGTVYVERDTTILVFTPGGGQQVVVQAPAALHWDDATLARFAESVAIGPNAKAGRG